MLPLGLLLVVIRILGFVSLLKYLSNSSMFYSPTISSSSKSSIIVSSGTLMLSIVAFLPFGTASSPSSSLNFLVCRDFNFLSYRSAILLLKTTSYRLCLFLISFASFSYFSGFFVPDLVFFLVIAAIFFSNFSILLFFRLSSTSFGS